MDDFGNRLSDFYSGHAISVAYGLFFVEIVARLFTDIELQRYGLVG